MNHNETGINEKAWADINAEKEIQAQLRRDAGIELDKDVEIFTEYLLECAFEIRSTKLTMRYLAEMCGSLVEKTEQFWQEQNEKCKVKGAPDYEAQRGISVPVDMDRSKD